MKIHPYKTESSGRLHNIIWATDDEFKVLKLGIKTLRKIIPKTVETYKTRQHLREVSRKLNNPDKN